MSDTVKNSSGNHITGNFTVSNATTNTHRETIQTVTNQVQTVTTETIYDEISTETGSGNELVGTYDANVTIQSQTVVDETMTNLVAGVTETIVTHSDSSTVGTPYR